MWNDAVIFNLNDEKEKMIKFIIKNDNLISDKDIGNAIHTSATKAANV